MTQDVTENLQVDPDDRTLSDLNEIDYRKVPVKALIDTFEKKKGKNIHFFCRFAAIILTSKTELN